MKVCVVLIGQPRSFELASISLRQVFERQLRPGDEIKYMPVFWDFNSSYFLGRTTTRVWDHEELYRKILQCYGEDHVISPTILDAFEAHSYLGGYGFLPEDIMYRSEEWPNRYKCTTMHQMWLFKRAAELFEEYTKTHEDWDLVIFTRPDMVFYDSDVNYEVLEDRLKYLKEHFVVEKDRWIGFGGHALTFFPLPIPDDPEERDKEPDHWEKCWIDDKIAIGTSKSLPMFFKAVWKMYIEHLNLAFEDPAILTTYPEEVWAQALVYLHCANVNVFERLTLYYEVLREFTLKYPEFKEMILNGTLRDFRDKYNKTTGEDFCYITEQAYLDYKKRKNVKSNLI